MAMNRIEAAFANWRQRQHKALIPYITAGDPAPEVTVPLMHAMVAAGADLLELGVPFSDPMADGPVICHAHERALRHGTSLRDVLDQVQEFRQRDDKTPVVLMGYLNPIEAMGYAAFVQRAVQAGVDGVLTVDLPPEEAGDLVAELHAADIAAIFLVAPTSGHARVQRIAAMARGYLYYVSLKGVTGAAHLDAQLVHERIETLRSLTTLPLAVGFGIKDAETAAAIADAADAVVVGSVLVQAIADHQHEPERAVQVVSELLAAMRTAIDTRER